MSRRNDTDFRLVGKMGVGEMGVGEMGIFVIYVYIYL